MNPTAAKIVDAVEEKQTPNRFETGCEVTRAATLLAEITDDWNDKQHRATVLLRALCRLAAEHPDQGKAGFTNLDLVEQVRKEGIKNFAMTRDGEDPDHLRKTVTKYFNQLIERWSKHEQGVIERFRDQGLPRVPIPTREEGGGRGNPTRYRLHLQPVPAETVHAAESLAASDADYPVRYYTDEIISWRVFRWLAQRGFALRGWRAGLFLGVMLLAIAGMIELFLLLWLGLINPPSVPGFISTAGSLITLIVLAWILGRPVVALTDNRITLAPWWLQPWRAARDDQLLELRRDTELDANVILLTRYTADCPTCGGKLAIASGRREFHGRLIGSCNRAPNEHVFSFDPVLRRGKRLR